MRSPTIDIDSHVSEPLTLIMDEYLDPEVRDRPMRLLNDEKGLEYLEIDGNKSVLIHGGIGLGLEAGKGFGTEDLADFYSPGKVHYYDGMTPESNDPHARIKWLDSEGLDMSIFYPTLGTFTWEDEVQDPRLAAAYCRAYNNWALDFSKPYPLRHIPVAHIPIIDVEEAVKEANRTAKLGAKGFIVNAQPANGRLYGDPYFDPFYAEVQEMGLPLTIHPTAHKNCVGKDVFSDSGDLSLALTDDFWYITITAAFQMQVALVNMVCRGAFDRFPDLKVVLLESGAGWLPYWLERMDDRWRTEKYSCQFELRPGEYFERQCWISFEPDEKYIPEIIEDVGADKFFWASDFPHADGFSGVVKRIRQTLESLPEDDLNKVLGVNAMEVYRL